MNSGVGGLNLLYKQTNDEVAVGEVGNPTASRHYPIYFNMTKYLDGIAVGLPENECVEIRVNIGVGGLNLLYKQTNDEVAVGEVGSPTASRHYPIHFNMTKYVDGILAGLPEDECREIRHESGVGGLNLLYKQTNDEVAVGEVSSPTASRHYPIHFNMTKYVDEISAGLPEDEIPVNNDALLAVQLPDNTCNPSHSRETFDLVVLVKSCVYCTEQRTYARKTYMKSDHWNNFRVKFVFVVGLPTPTPTNIHYFNGVTVVLNGRSERLSKSLQSSGWSALRELKKESDSHGDVLIGGFYDNYFNLTKKMMLTFRWASTTFHKRTPLFLFLDDDYVLHPENTIKLVRSLNRSEVKWFAGGQVHPTSVVVRPAGGVSNSRWSISRDEYPWDYFPPYFFGVCYILGAELVEHASIVMSFTQDLRMDDAYLGIVLARLNKSLTNLKQFSVSTRNVDHMSSLVNIERSMANRLFTSD
uniref:Hexosyltransferase n=1 Tax=Trichobilharzia regenti TaxID=157069 RepID=A0AA85KDY3_TRIRE|nr:unnamed protein product [Trichobilharzia regenti]